MACEKTGEGRSQERPRHRTMPYVIVFYNDCFNVNFHIADEAFVMELRDSIQIYEEAAKENKRDISD